MKFTIHYKANWGETLCVDLTFGELHGMEENTQLMMQTQDGYLWETETYAREPRVMSGKKHYDFIKYYYKVVDADGKVKRIEWLGSPRVYPYTASKDYLFRDFWLEDETPKLKENEVFSLQNKVVVEPDEGMIQPLFDRTILFRVSAPHLHEGEAVALLGNHPALGNWNKEHFLLMNLVGANNWVLSVNVEPIDVPIEYKYVVVDMKTLRFKRWEYGENRKVGEDYVHSNEVCVQHGGKLRKMKLPEHAQFDFDTYVFDLDGTLLSTLEDLAASCNYALRANHLPERTLEEVRMMVGNGVEMLMRRAVGDKMEDQACDFAHIMSDFRNHYMAHSLDHTQPYPDVMDMLEELKARGKNVAVVSNKFYAATQELCRHFFGDLVDVAIGAREDIQKKPAPDTVFEALRQMKTDVQGAVYIGDSDVDVMTARNSGMPCISVLWGFRDREFLAEHGASIFVSTPRQLL